jgi:hypothetical protein
MPVKLSKSLVFVVPGRLETLTGGYGYDRRIAAGLSELGWSVAMRALDDRFPRPTPRAREDAAHVLASIPDDATVLVDGLALGALPEEAGREPARLRLVALVRHPMAAAMSPSGMREGTTRYLRLVASRMSASAISRICYWPRRYMVSPPCPRRTAPPRAAVLTCRKRACT